jgi:hypothetical protein
MSENKRRRTGSPDGDGDNMDNMVFLDFMMEKFSDLMSCAAASTVTSAISSALHAIKTVQEEAAVKYGELEAKFQEMSRSKVVVILFFI